MSIQNYLLKEGKTLLKYVDYFVTFQEVPNEVSLVFTISGCPLRCPGCHSPWLHEDTGRELLDDLERIVEKYEHEITCVCIMGTGETAFIDIGELRGITRIVRSRGLKLCFYTGFTEFPDQYLIMPDYLKIGPYVEKLGGLNSPETNQRMYKLENARYIDITSEFWKPKV